MVVVGLLINIGSSFLFKFIEKQQIKRSQKAKEQYEAHVKIESQVIDRLVNDNDYLTSFEFSSINLKIMVTMRLVIYPIGIFFISLFHNADTFLPSNWLKIIDAIAGILIGFALLKEKRIIKQSRKMDEMIKIAREYKEKKTSDENMVELVKLSEEEMRILMQDKQVDRDSGVL